MILDVAGKNITLDDEGYLVNLPDWSPEVANILAMQENIRLTEQHWQILYLLRAFYQEYALSPANRPLINYLKQQLPTQSISSLTLNLLFNGSPAKLAAKLAGLPKPSNCL